MATKLTLEEIYEINKRYREVGTYAGVAKEFGRSAGTIKKYIDPDWIPKEEEKEYVFDPQIFTGAPFEWTKEEILANRCVLFASEALRTEELRKGLKR